MNLSEFLKKHRFFNKILLRDLEETAKDLDFPPGAKTKAKLSFFSRLESNKIPITNALLDYVAKAYGIEKQHLLPFYAKEKHFFTTLSIEDFKKTSIRDSVIDEVEVFQGEYRLEGSYITPLFMKLKPNTKDIVPHAHNGEELIIVKSGEMVLHLIDIMAQIPLQSGQLIHFNSSNSHAIINKSDDYCEVYIIRLPITIDKKK